MAHRGSNLDVHPIEGYRAVAVPQRSDHIVVLLQRKENHSKFVHLIQQETTCPQALLHDVAVLF